MIEGKPAMRDRGGRSVESSATPRRERLRSPHFVMLTAVRVLYGVLLLSTMVIVAVAVAVARHIAQHRRAIRSQAETHEDSV